MSDVLVFSAQREMEIIRDSLTYVGLPVCQRLVLYFKLKNKDQTGRDVPADTSSNQALKNHPFSKPTKTGKTDQKSFCRKK
jgi:hypothetical protein